jgi:hypothetical protein
MGAGGGPALSDSVVGARELVDALLANADVPLVEEGEPDPPPADLGAAGGWRFSSREHGIEADVYVLDDPQAVLDAVSRLLEAAGPQDDRGLPECRATARWSSPCGRRPTRMRSRTSTQP